MSPSRRPIRDGLNAGLIASATVAALYGAFDVMTGHGLLYTVNLLGRAVFSGLMDPAVVALPLPPDVVAIAMYSALHVAVAVGIGLLVTSLIDRMERRPAEARLIQLLLVALFFATLGVVGWLSAAFRPLVPWWTVAAANLLAGVVAGIWLIRRHPEWRHLLAANGGR